MAAKQEWLACEMRIPAFKPGEIEREGYARGYHFIAGLDEVGVGPLAGPVIAAAVVLPRGLLNEEIKDSKLLGARKREKLASWIKQNAVAWALGTVGPEEIDRINILNASHLAMAYAVKQLDPAPDYLLIDGSF
jgi:ribonuclease HII